MFITCANLRVNPLSPKYDPNLLSSNHKPTAFSNNNPGHADHAQVSKAQLFGE